MKRFWQALLRPLARRLLRWAQAVLAAEESAPAVEVEPVELLLFRRAGPPAHWLEKVRRGAPGLLLPADGRAVGRWEVGAVKEPGEEDGAQRESVTERGEVEGARTEPEDRRRPVPTRSPVAERRGPSPLDPLPGRERGTAFREEGGTSDAEEKSAAPQGAEPPASPPPGRRSIWARKPTAEPAPLTTAAATQAKPAPYTDEAKSPSPVPGEGKGVRANRPARRTLFPSVAHRAANRETDRETHREAHREADRAPFAPFAPSEPHEPSESHEPSEPPHQPERPQAFEPSAPTPVFNRADLPPAPFFQLPAPAAPSARSASRLSAARHPILEPTARAVASGPEVAAVPPSAPPAARRRPALRHWPSLPRPAAEAAPALADFDHLARLEREQRGV